MHTKVPWSMEVKPVQNGYIFCFYANGLLLGEMYGSTNAMWDFVPGAAEGEANARRLIDLMNAHIGISMMPLEMIQEWRKGCSCATASRPEECHECTRALIDALQRTLTQQPSQNPTSSSHR